MYVNKKTGKKLSVQDMQKYADENEVSIEEYANDFGFVLEEVDEDTTSADLLDPTTFQTDAAADADVVSQPMTASQAEYVEPEDTELAPVDTSLDSQDPEPNPFSEKYLEFSSGYDKNKKSRIYEEDYAQNYAGQTWNKNNRSGTYPDSFEDFAKQFNTELRQDNFEKLDEVVVKAKTSDFVRDSKKKAEKLVELRDGVTEVSQKTNIGLDYFKLKEKNGELVPNVERKTSTKDTGNGRESSASGDLGYFLNDYETDLKDSLGPEKYEKYKLLQTNLDVYNSLLAQSGNQPEVLSKNNLKELFNLEEIDSDTKTNVINAKKLEETEIFLRGVSPKLKREMNRFLPMSERAREEVEKIRQKRITDAEDYKAKYGVTLVREETIGGRTYTPPDTGILDDKGYEKVFADEEKRLTIDKSVLERDVKNFITEQTKLEKESTSYKANLLDLSNRIKEIDSYAIPSVDLEKQRNELVLEYNSILKEDGFKNLVTINKKLINDQQSLQNRIQNISKNTNDFIEGSAISKTLLKSYELSDRFAQVMEESFLGSSSMLAASFLKGTGDIAMALTEDSKLGDLLNEGDWYDNLVNLKGAAINYNQRLKNRREKYLPANLKASDSSSTMQYIGDMLVNNSPSILVALGTMGGGSIAGAGLSGAARAQASRSLTNTATGIFFTMEAGGKMSELEIGQKEAQGNINKLKVALASAVGTVEREEILNQIQDQTDLLNLSQLKKSFSSIMYGGIASFAERTGGLRFMNNFSKLSTNMSQKLISKYGYEGINKAVAKSVGALGTTGIGVGVELLEEGLTLVGHNIVDNVILGQDKSLIEGLDGEFFRNTVAISLAISGPQASQNIYAAISSEIKTNAENKKETELRDELIEIQNQLNEVDPVTGKRIDGRTKTGKALIDRKKAIIKESALLNAEIVGKMANMSAEDIEAVFENNRVMRSKRREAAELGNAFNVSKYAQGRLKTLTDEYKILQEENQATLGKNRKEFEAFFKEAQNTPQAVYNAELFEFSKNIARSADGVQVLEFASNDSGDGRTRFEEYLKNEVKLGNISQENSDAALKGYDGDEGFVGASAANIGNKLFIFRDNAMRSMLLDNSLGGSIAAISPMHELGHIQTRKAGIIKDDAVVGDAKIMVDGILTYVKERFESGMLSKENYDIFNKRIEAYKAKEGDENQREETKGIDADELIQLVSDFTALGILPKSSFTQLTGTKMFVNSLLKKLNGDASMFFRMDSPSDVFNFISSWQNKAFSFELDGVEDEDDTLKESKQSALLQEQLDNLDESDYDFDPDRIENAKDNLKFKINAAKKKEIAKPKTTEFDTSEKSTIGQINNLVPKEITTNEEFKEDANVQRKIDKAFSPNGIISNIIKGRFGGGELFEETLKSVKNRALKYNPAAERKKAGNNKPVTFAEFIFSNVNFGKLDAAKKLAIEEANKKNQTDLDNKEAQSKTNEESSESALDNRKTYKPLTSNPKLIPGFVVSEIKNKLTNVISKLTSKLSTRPKGANAQTTPLIGEIKKAIGNVVGDNKALPKQIIKRMGSPKDGSYQKFLIDNKKSILENMTTTYLQLAIPAAVEKSVGGAYVLDENGKRKKDSNNNDIFKPKFVPYPEWVGKEIDREKVSTNKKGSTSGNDIVRRAIKFENKEGRFEDSITNEDFVANFVGSDGKVIRGKRESLGKALAEEAGFEVLTKELQDDRIITQKDLDEDTIGQFEGKQVGDFISDIRQMFESNQKALGEVLADNFVQQVARDAERGTVKFSKAAFRTEIKDIDGSIDNIINYLNKKNIYNVGGFGMLNELSLKDDELSKLMKKNRELWQAYVLQGTKSKLTPRQQGKFLNIKNKSGIEYQKWINNSLNYYFNAIDATFGLEPGTAVLQNPNAKAAALDTMGKLLDDIISTNKINPIEEFLNITKGWTVSGKSISIFGNNTGLYNWITSKERSELIQNAVSKSGLNLKKSKNSETNKTLYLNKNKALNTIKQETTGKDLMSIYIGKNEVDLTNRDTQSEIAKKHLKTIFDFLRKQSSQKTILPEGAALILKTMNSSMRGSLKTAAKIEGAYLVEGLKAGDYTFEHGIPVTVISTMAAKYITDPTFEWDNIKNAIDKSKVYIIPKKIAKIIDTFYKATFSIDNALDTENPAIYRYQEVNKGLKDALKAAGVVNFDFNNFTYFRDSGKKITINTKFSKGSLLKVTEKEFSNLSKQEDVYYHGTSAIVNEEFINKETVKDFPEGASSFSVEMQGLGKHYTKSLENAKSFIDHRNRDDNTGTVGAVSIVIRNPKQFKSYQALLKDIKSTVKNKNLSIAERNKTYLDNLKSNGFDSIIYEEGPSYNPSKKNLMAKAIIPFDSSKKLIGTADYNQRNEGMVKGSAVVNNIKKALDPKGKVYKPSVKFSKTMNSTFNKMLERKTGIAADETISRVIARRKGIKKGKFKVFMPSSLDDFKGLTSYTFAGKGKQGEADQKFFQDTLIDPYFKGIRAIEETRQSFKDDFKALNKKMSPVIKKLGKLVPGTEFTHDQAIRVALWNASGYEIPGLSEIDQKKLVDYVNDNADLSEYARTLQQISKRPKWAKPGDFWDAETILSDLNNLTEKVGRKEFLSEFIENADIIFSEDNLNKVEAGYGKATRDALEDILYRMKNGTNRPSASSDNTNRFNTWINNSIGAIMFFNRRSALLQTLSTVNFINWSDNNPLKAAAAFANQKQYWSDFATLFNSSKLKQRRSGLKSDVNEAEIARAVKGSKNKAVAALSYLLKIGFTPTQMADSFAIAAGGATFYRNRIKSYLKKVNKEGEALYTKEQAEEMAFKDFSQISEETQQSGDPALISSDQASTAGRLLLAFQNTPIQLNRSIKKAALDIKNRRRTPGQTLAQSNFSNFSKIIYYGTVQSVIFSALQNALFALIPGFEDEDDELTEKEQLEKYGKVYSTKQSRIIQGMIDTTLKGGFGLPGAGISMIKNLAMEYDKQEEKGFMADHAYTILAFFNIMPSIGSKGRKIYSAIQTKRFEKDVIEKRGWDVTIDGKFNLSPSYKVLGSVTEGLTNLPLDRVVSELNALTEALDYRNTVWQRVALALGWRSWDVGAKNEEHELIKTEAKAKRKEEGKIKAKETRAKNKKIADTFYKKVGKTLTKKEKQEYFSFSGKTRRRKYLDEIAKQKGIK